MWNSSSNKPYDISPKKIKNKLYDNFINFRRFPNEYLYKLVDDHFEWVKFKSLMVLGGIFYVIT